MSNVKYQYLRMNNYVLTILSDVSHVDDQVVVSWATCFKSSKEAFCKKSAREAVHMVERNTLVVNQDFTRNEIVTKILAHLYYNSSDKSATYHNFIQLYLYEYISSSTYKRA